MTALATPPLHRKITALRRLHACPEAIRWLEARPAETTWQQAWDACERGDWMAWLIGRLACDTPWGSPERRRLHGALVELLISLARPLSNARTDAAIEGVIELLQHSERGEDVPEDDFRAGAAGAADAAWAAWAASAANAAKAADAASAAWAANAACAVEIAGIAGIAGVAGAACATGTASLSAAAEVYRARYPRAPEL